MLTDELLRKRGLRDKTRLVFFTPYPRPYPAEPMNQIVEPVLRERGIEVLTFFDVDRIDPAASTIYSIEGDEIHYDLPIVIPPFTGADIAYTPANAVDESRFVVTDKLTLRVRGTDTVFAIGDGTNLPTSKSGVGAHLEAKTVARALAGHPAAFNGRTHCPFDFGHGQGTFVTGSYEAPVVRSPPGPPQAPHEDDIRAHLLAQPARHAGAGIRRLLPPHRSQTGTPPRDQIPGKIRLNSPAINEQQAAGPL